MKLDSKKWAEGYKTLVEKSGAKPSSGVICAVATIQYIAAGLKEDVTEDEWDSVRDGLNELLTQIKSDGKLDLSGFASNASAAAKAAGYKEAAKLSLEIDEIE